MKDSSSNFKIFKSQVSIFRISSCKISKSQISSSKFQPKISSLKIPKFQFSKFQIQNFQFPISNSKLQVSKKKKICQGFHANEKNQIKKEQMEITHLKNNGTTKPSSFEV